MGTVGMLMAAYKEELLSKDEILNCIDILKNNGRHISGKLYDQLIQKLEVQ
jgi:predicted nucleic acid-binding protein